MVNVDDLSLESLKAIVARREQEEKNEVKVFDPRRDVVFDSVQSVPDIRHLTINEAWVASIDRAFVKTASKGDYLLKISIYQDEDVPEGYAWFYGDEQLTESKCFVLKRIR